MFWIDDWFVRIAALTYEAHVGDMVDGNSAVDLREGSEHHGSGCETKDVDGDTERRELAAVGFELYQQLRHTRRKHRLFRHKVSIEGQSKDDEYGRTHKTQAA